MGGFGTALKAIGNANLPGITQQVTNTAINLSQLQNQQRHQQVMEQQAAQELELRRQAGEVQRLQAEEYKKDHELIPIDETLKSIGFTSPEEIAYFTKKAGLHVQNVAGSNYIQKGVGRDLFMKMSGNPEDNISIGLIRTGNTDKAIADIDAQLNGGGNLKPEQLQALQDQRQQLVKQKTTLANGLVIENRKLQASLKEKQYLATKNGVFDTFSGKMVPETSEPKETWGIETLDFGNGKKVVVNKSNRGKATHIATIDENKNPAEDKTVKAAIARLEQYRTNNEADIARLQARGEATDNLEEANRVIDNTKSRLLNGDIAAADIKWDQTVDFQKVDYTPERKKLRKDLIANGYSAKGADDYIKRAIAKGKI